MEPFSSNDAVYDASDVAAAVPNLAPSAYQQWLKRGLTVLASPSLGSGRRRPISALEIVGVAFMADLADFGIPPSASARLVPEIKAMAARFLEENPPRRKDTAASVLGNPISMSASDAQYVLRHAQFGKELSNAESRDEIEVIMRKYPDVLIREDQQDHVNIPADTRLDVIIVEAGDGELNLFEDKSAEFPQTRMPSPRVVVDVAALAAKVVNRLLSRRSR